MTPLQSIFIWQGSVHLGDEPGIYGDSLYSGLSVEFPLTVKAMNPAAPAADKINLEITSENVIRMRRILGKKLSFQDIPPTQLLLINTNGKKQYWLLM